MNNWLGDPSVQRSALSGRPLTDGYPRPGDTRRHFEVCNEIADDVTGRDITENSLPDIMSGRTDFLPDIEAAKQLGDRRNGKLT